MRVTIKGKKYEVDEVFDTKEEAFAYKKILSNQSKIYFTDDGKYAMIIICQDVTNLH